MVYKVRPATVLDILSIAKTGRRQRILRLNPPYTLVQPDPLVRDMLRTQVPIRRQTSHLYVYVEREAVLGYIQARARWRRRDEWAITMMGTTERAPDRIWEPLLEEVCREAGEAGVTRLFCKVPKNDPVIDLFRGFGFTQYTNEHVWGNLYFTPTGAQLNEPERGLLRRHTNKDAWDLQQLYRAVSPPAAQRAEAQGTGQWRASYFRSPRLIQQGLTENAYVWPSQWEGDHAGTALGGFVRLLTGARGHWITVMYRQDAGNRAICGQALDYVLWKASRLGTKPVYCAVREYQAEIESLLDERGFHMLTEQALVVKYIAEPVKAPQPALVPFLVQKKGELVATDFSAWKPSNQI